MRRFATRLVLLLLLGALVNFGVAILIGILGFPIEGACRDWTSTEALPYWNPRVENAQTYFPFVGRRYCAWGVDEVVMTGGRRNSNDVRTPYEITLLLAGIPSRSIAGELHCAGNTCNAIWAMKDPIGLDARNYRSGRSTVILPLRPLWPGFALNTIFYAAVLWIVFAAPGVMRRRLRHFRGRCVHCGYDLRGQPPDSIKCSECGRST